MIKCHFIFGTWYREFFLLSELFANSFTVLIFNTSCKLSGAYEYILGSAWLMFKLNVTVCFNLQFLFAVSFKITKRAYQQKNCVYLECLQLQQIGIKIKSILVISSFSLKMIL